MLSRERVVAAKARAAAATEGPWATWVDGILVGVCTDDGNREIAEPVAPLRIGDAEFIASARADVPVMADALLRVLDLHHAVTGNPDRDRPWHEATWCAQGCDAWPCATVRAVTGTT